MWCISYDKNVDLTSVSLYSEWFCARVKIGLCVEFQWMFIQHIDLDRNGFDDFRHIYCICNKMIFAKCGMKK